MKVHNSRPVCNLIQVRVVFLVANNVVNCCIFQSRDTRWQKMFRRECEEKKVISPMVKLTSKVVSKGMFMQWEIFAQSRIAAKLKKFQFDRQLQPASWKVWVIARLSKSQWFDAQQEQMGKNVWNFSTINFAEKFFCISQRKSFSTKIVKKTFMCRSNAMQWEKNKNTFHSHLLRKKR